MPSNLKLKFLIIQVFCFFSSHAHLPKFHAIPDHQLMNAINSVDPRQTLQHIPGALEALKEVKIEEKVRKFVDTCDRYRTVPEIIESRGYLCESHEVKTKDGYILTLHRLINPLMRRHGKPVILMHGLFGSSADWLIQNAGGHLGIGSINGTFGNMLGFELSRRGYDVWLPNARGNTYSQKHVSLHPNVKSFWEFSFNEMVEMDTPAILDHVMSACNTFSVSWVGHSSGADQILALMSLKPKYSECVRPLVMLAPTVFNGHSTVPIMSLANNRTLKHMIKHNGQFLNNTAFWKLLTRTLCSGPTSPTCIKWALIGLGPNTGLDWRRLEVYLAHTPSATSTWTFAHDLQRYVQKRFAKFDFMSDARNILEYGSTTPPEYPIELIKNDFIAMVSSIDDKSATVQDIHLLRQKLKVDLLDDYVITRTGFGHLDYIWGRDVGQVAYSQVVKTLDAVA